MNAFNAAKECSHGLRGVLLNSNFETLCERPPAAFGGFPLTRGEYVISPS